MVGVSVSRWGSVRQCWVVLGGVFHVVSDCTFIVGGRVRTYY